MVSIMYHPCELVHKQFWDGVNFAKGANPPRSAWKPPPQKTADETKHAYRIFADYIAFMKRFPDVQFITASEAAKLYADRATEAGILTPVLEKIARKVGRGRHLPDARRHDALGERSVRVAESLRQRSGREARRSKP